MRLGVDLGGTKIEIVGLAADGRELLRRRIATPQGEVFINPTGTPALATGGSGDVLTGIIAGLAAQGISVQEAALAGVYMHGLAGDLASKGIIGMAAGEISQYLPQARRIIEQGE